MRTTVEPLEGNKVKLSVEVDEQEFDKAIDAAFRKIAHEVRIPGFRPGKAPRRVLEARFGKDAARQQALQDSLPEYYVQALVDNDIDAIASPELDITAGQESGPVAFEATVEVRPQIRVPGYDGLQVTIPSPLVGDAEVDAQVDRMRNAFATLSEVDRQAHPGDHVKIDIAGTIDGEAVAGLTADDYLYEVGVKAVVPELDDHLVGAGAGDVVEFTAPVPGSDEGKEIAFRVAVKAVNEKVLPEADDEWASTASEFSSVAELREDIRKRMAMMKRVQSHLAMRDQVVKALVELVDDEAPQPLVDTEIQRRIDDLAHRLSHQGATIDQFLAATGQSEQELIGQYREAAEESVKADLALRSVADAEGIEADDSDLDAELERLATRFKMKAKDVRKQLERTHQMPALVSDVRKTKALTWLMERVSVVDDEGHAIDRKDLELSDDELGEAEAQAELLDQDHDHDHDDHEGHDH